MSKFTYFAYGSNMLFERLRERCRSAQIYGTAVVPGYTLVFNKESKDGSGKANIVETSSNNDILYGVMFKIDLNERPLLDKCEGKGYERVNSFVVKQSMNNEEESVVTTYIARRTSDKDKIPYDWYKDLIVAGALRNRLPTSYIAWLETFPSIPDPYLERGTRKEAISILNSLS